MSAALLAFTHPSAAVVPTLALGTYLEAAKLVRLRGLLLLFALALLLGLSREREMRASQSEPDSQPSQDITAGCSREQQTAVGQ